METPVPSNVSFLTPRSGVGFALDEGGYHESWRDRLWRCGLAAGCGGFSNTATRLRSARENLRSSKNGRRSILGEGEDSRGGRCNDRSDRCGASKARQGGHPWKQFISASASFDLARYFGRDVRNIIESEAFQAVYPTRLSEDSRAGGKWNTSEGGCFYAVGVGGAVLGRGGDVVLIDDPFGSTEEARSPVIREKVWNWYTGTIYNRLQPDGAIVVINHRLHEDDLSGRLIAGFQKRRPSSGCAIGSIRAAISAISTGLRTTKARARHERGGATSLPHEYPGDVKPARRFAVARRHAPQCTAESSKAMNVQPVAARLSATRQRRRSSWRRW